MFGVLCCPSCQGELDKSKTSYHCSNCQCNYPIFDGIPDFYKTADEDLANEISDLNQHFFDSTANNHEHDCRRLRSKTLRFFLKRFIAKEAFEKYSQNRIKEIVSHYYKKDGIFLDVGCGTGNVLKAADKVWGKVVGIDISQNMLIKAKQRNLNTLRANNYKTPFENGSFDMISSFSVVHHMADLRAFFSEMSRISKTGGIFYTDYDPNPIALQITRKSIVYKKITTLLKSIFKKDFYKEYSPTNYSANLVDYHTVETESYNIENLKEIINDCGFTIKRMCFHSDSFSIFNTRFINTRFEQKIRRFIKHLIDKRRTLEECGEYVLFILEKRKDNK